jgi:hypothetical protein
MTQGVLAARRFVLSDRFDNQAAMPPRAAQGLRARPKALAQEAFRVHLSVGGGGLMETAEVTLPDGSQVDFPAKCEREKWVPEDHAHWTFVKLSRWFAIRR